MATQRPVYKIGGVSVHFPAKPYPSQFSMMDKIIKGIDRQQNCLLESPTGSGKSLALLCSALGWQAEQLAKKDQEELEQSMSMLPENCACQCHHQLPSPIKLSPQDQGTSVSPNIVETVPDGEDDDFKDANTSYRTPTTNKGLQKLRKHVAIDYEDDYTPNKLKADNSVCQESDATATCCKQTSTIDPANCDCCWKNTSPVTKVPRIYFGTRTHKQVAQIVRELKKTAYHDVRMTILGSREYTCIHPAVSRSKNKNEGCAELIKGPGCRFKDRTKRLESQKAIKNYGLESAWDLEDLVGLCRTTKACPYFLSRGLKTQSDLVICPYNYLIDPLIRESMEINLTDQIIILDEAHNIEDSSREAASQTINLDILEKATQEIDKLLGLNLKVSDHLKLLGMTRSLTEFINTQSSKLEQKDYEQSCKIWSGFDIIAEMQAIQLGPKAIPDLVQALASVGEELDDITKQRLGHDGKLTTPVLTLFEQMFLVFKYLYSNDMKFVEDYRTVLLKTISYTNTATNGQWLNPKHRRGGHRVPVVSYSLNFWCMSPAVAFSEFSDCRSVVLTSGTLSPMSSFQSELGLPFPIQLEANHVIKDNQVWVGTLGQGPSGHTLQAVYRNLETLTFQDELGQLILQICQTVPKGVLCFLPSYKVLDKLSQRWQSTGLWEKIQSSKVVISEPRGGDKEDFENIMQRFYQASEGGEVDSDYEECGGESETTGALLIAVCRGKVSEGLDFSDNYARAVISVGIPYPNFKDLQVELKRKYNDQHRLKKGLLSGGDWYEIQAFRALNQALGRCIRHRADWGCLILVDDRFVKNGQKYCKGLSKWVRNKVNTFYNFKSGISSLTNFVQYRVEHHNDLGANTSLISSTPTTPGGPKLDDMNPTTPGGPKLDDTTPMTPGGPNLDKTCASPQTPAARPEKLTSLYSFNRRLHTTSESLRSSDLSILPKTEDNNFNHANLASIFKVTNTQIQQRIAAQTPSTSKARAITPLEASTPSSKTNSGMSNQPVSTDFKKFQVTPNGLVTNLIPIGQPMQVIGQPTTPIQVIQTKPNLQTIVSPTLPNKTNNVQMVYVLPSKSNQASGQTVISPNQKINLQNATKYVIVSPPTKIVTSTQSNVPSHPQTVLLSPNQNVSLPQNTLNAGQVLLSPTSKICPQNVNVNSGKPVTQVVNVANVNGQLVALPQSGKQKIKVANINGKLVVVPQIAPVSTAQIDTSSVAQNVAQNVTISTSGTINTSSSVSDSKSAKNSGSQINPIQIPDTPEKNIHKDIKTENSESKSIPVETASETKVNKFFKFCKIPNSETEKTPQKQGIEKTDMENTPPLFDSDLDFDDTKPPSKPITRRPLFKQTSGTETLNKNTKIADKKTEVVDKNTKIVDKKTEVVNKNTKILDKKTEILDKKTEKCESKTSIRSSITTRRSSLSLFKSKMDKSNETCDPKPQSAQELDIPDKEVFADASNENTLTVRRGSRGKRRRSSGSNVRHAPKKSKGVEFLEESETIDSNNSSKKKCTITCSGCGVVLSQNQHDIEKRMRVPPFFPAADDMKSSEVLYLAQLNNDDYLKPLATQLGTGQQLNSLFSVEEKVCVKYLTCISCYPGGTTQEMFGCQVVYTEQQSKYSMGQTWLLSDKVKIT